MGKNKATGQRKSEVIQVITRDNIRQLHPHKPNNQKSSATPKAAVFLSTDEYSRIKAQSSFLTKEEQLKRSLAASHDKNTAYAAAQKRKAKMEEYERKRAQNAKLTESEIEAKEKRNYLLTKAQQQLNEDEDEIKHMNELILYAKCVAIRDAQVEEKQMIEEQKKEEEQRQDAMMEVYRVNELKKLEERGKKRQAVMREGAAVIRQQIDERRELALLEQERKDQETKAILKAIQDMAQQDIDEKKTRIEAQRKLMESVGLANQESMDRKKELRQKDIDEDRKVMEYLLEKEKREIELDRLANIKLADREKELARLRSMQEKTFDKQAQQDSLRAKRAIEAYEREWRRKEKETAEKHSLQEKMLREERTKQQTSRQHAIAIEAHKMKEEFYASIERQKEIEVRLRAEEIEKHKKNKQYSVEVQTQIREKEKNRLREREDFFMEGIRREKERVEKRDKIQSIKNAKIQQLRKIGVPDKYVGEIERKSNKDLGMAKLEKQLKI